MVPNLVADLRLDVRRRWSFLLRDYLEFWSRDVDLLLDKVHYGRADPRPPVRWDGR